MRSQGTLPSGDDVWAETWIRWGNEPCGDLFLAEGIACAKVPRQGCLCPVWELKTSVWSSPWARGKVIGSEVRGRGQIRWDFVGWDNRFKFQISWETLGEFWARKWLLSPKFVIPASLHILCDFGQIIYLLNASLSIAVNWRESW